MVRAPCCEKTGLKKGPWTAEEDLILVNFIAQNGHPNWRALPKRAGTSMTQYVALFFFYQNTGFTYGLSLFRIVEVW